MVNVQDIIREIDDIRKKSEEINDEGNRLLEEACGVLNTIKPLLYDLLPFIFDKSLFTIIDIKYSLTLRLSEDDEHSKKARKRLDDCWKPLFLHEDINLNDTTIRIDDEATTVCFDDMKGLQAFIKKTNSVVAISRYIEDKERLEKALSNLEDLQKIINTIHKDKK